MKNENTQNVERDGQPHSATAAPSSPESGTETADRTSHLELPVPAVDSSLYRYGATDAILCILVDNPYAEFTIRDLARATGANSRSISQAVDVLEANRLVITRHEGNKRLVAINRNRLSKPDDPILRIPQPEFHPPVRAALDRLEDELEDVRGIVVFGSVARAEADRQSDIDLWVLVAGDKAANQRRAHEIANDLGTGRFDGDRYEFQILVESIDTATDYGDRLHDVFASGLTLRDSDDLRDLKREVLRNA